MTTVIDIGCARYGGSYSIERLIAEFHPGVLYGFDPNAGLPDLPKARRRSTNVVIDRKAAWIYDGEIGFHSDGLVSYVTDRPDAPQIPCFDLAAFILGLDNTDIILKIDAEGAEYELMRHLHVHRVDRLLRLAWIEWHDFGVPDPKAQRRMIEATAACEIREWVW